MRSVRIVVVTSLLAVMATTFALPTDAQQRMRRLLEQRRDAPVAAALPADTRIERDLAYGTHPKQRFDAYLPAGASRAPIVLMVHGGGWRIGDKDNPGVAGDKAAYWLAKGFVFVSTNYRLLPDAAPLQQAQDVAAALARVQALAPQWGADASRVVLVGHSAGAHLVALLGADPTLLEQAGARRPRGVVSLDSAAMDVPDMMKEPLLPRIYADAFGNDPAVWVSVSPHHRLAHDALPMLLVCSSRRPDACPQGRALAQKASGLGVVVGVQPEDMTHAEINRDLGKPSAYTQTVGARVDAWVE